MEKSQVETIVALLCGLEVAVAHIATILDSKGIASRSETAQSFRGVAEKTATQELVGAATAVIFKRIAKTIEQIDGQGPDEIRKFLH